MYEGAEESEFECQASVGLYITASGRYWNFLSPGTADLKQTFTNINLAQAWNLKSEKEQKTQGGTEIFWNPGQQPTLEIITGQICLRSPHHQ